MKIKPPTSHTQVHRLTRRRLEPAQNVLVVAVGIDLFGLMLRTIALLFLQIFSIPNFCEVIAEAIFNRFDARDSRRERFHTFVSVKPIRFRSRRRSARISSEGFDYDFFYSGAVKLQALRYVIEKDDRGEWIEPQPPGPESRKTLLIRYRLTSFSLGFAVERWT